MVPDLSDQIWIGRLSSDALRPWAGLEEVPVVAAGDVEALLLFVVLEEVPGLALVGHVGPEAYRVPVRVVPQMAAGGQRRVHALPPGARVDLEVDMD